MRECQKIIHCGKENEREKKEKKRKEKGDIRTSNLIYNLLPLLTRFFSIKHTTKSPFWIFRTKIIHESV